MANIKPHEYTNLPPFRAWCQKVIPLVYEDSLSYYELLCKVIDYLNKMLIDLENMGIDITNLYAAYNEFTNYVENYLKNLDVQDEINNKLDEMTKDGTLTAIIKPLILATLPPYIVDSVSQMTDTNRTYVLKSNSHVYQYVTGTGWVDTGIVYGSTIGNVLTNAGQLANGSDLNSITENVYYFISAPNTGMQNLPVQNTPLWLFTYATPTASIRLQIAYVYNRNQYFVRSMFNGWTDWVSLTDYVIDTIKPNYIHTDLTNRGDTIDANTIENGTIIFRSTGTATNYLNFPEDMSKPYPGWLLTLAYSSLTTQVFIPFYMSIPMRYRRKDANNFWTEWDNMAIIPQVYENDTIDIDAVTYDCNFLVPDSTAISNNPFTGAVLFVECVKYSNSISYQTITDWSTGRKKTRIYQNGWKDWIDFEPLNYLKLTYLHTTQEPTQSPTVNANDLQNGTIVFCSTETETEYINFPTENGVRIPGYCLTLSMGSLTQQYYLPYESLMRRAYYHRVKRIGQEFKEWEVMINTPRIFPNDTIDYDTIIEESDYLVPDSTTIVNSPARGNAQYLKTVNYGNGIIHQICTSFTNYNKMYMRSKVSTNAWNAWVTIGGDAITYNITKNITENTYNNTYNITTNPAFTTDENGWLNAIDNESTAEADATDMTGAIMSLLNDTGYCHLGVGTFYVSGNIELPSGAMIEGCGSKTIVRLLSNNNNYVFRPVRYSTIRDLYISGGKSFTPTEDIGGRNAIYFYDNKVDWNSAGEKDTRPCVISGVYFENFNGAAIYGHGTGDSTDESLIVSDCYIRNCACGINLDFLVEYCKFTNIITRDCYYACINNGGNNVFTNCTFHGTVGFVIDNSSDDKINNAHGSCIGCSFNHTGGNNGIAIQLLGATNGFLFEGSQIWYGKIVINNSHGILFNGILGGGNTTAIEVSNSTGVYFRNGQFNMTPPINAVDNTRLVFDNIINWLTGAIIEPV